ncbi:unnamed protein product, partial [marine sediment metagenome]
MAELYTTGVNRIVYRSVGFATGLTVTAHFWSPATPPVRSGLQTFTEVELGLYRLDYNFASLGTYFGLFYETAVATTSGVFRVTELAPEAGGNIAAIKAKTDNLPSGVAKNVALNNLMFTMVLSADGRSPATGKTVVAQISKDGAAFVNCALAVAEVSSGWYKINLQAAEMNADIVALKFT